VLDRKVDKEKSYYSRIATRFFFEKINQFQDKGGFLLGNLFLAKSEAEKK